ncbi:Clavaminate synthase-like protein [Marasmius fiardii PR-910]|nr:Clavaminate synthase-like protein [Marasmius fiardii PR-910]
MFFNQSIDDKKKIVLDYEGGGSHFGYREPQLIEVGDEVGGKKLKVMQNVERLNIPKIPADGKELVEPLHDLINEYRSDIAEFQQLCYDKVLRRLLVLFAIVLKLPEDYFIERHDFWKPSEDHLKYHARPQDEDQKVKDTWLRGHTDFGGIICNAADVMSFLTKGYIKSCIHRVVCPPSDQAHLHRISLIYVLRPNNDLPMIPAPSPVLVEEGLIGKEANDEQNEVVTGYEYVRARAGHFNSCKSWTLDQKGEEEKFIVKIKHLSVQDYYV